MCSKPIPLQFNGALKPTGIAAATLKKACCKSRLASPTSSWTRLLSVTRREQRITTNWPTARLNARDGHDNTPAIEPAVPVEGSNRDHEVVEVAPAESAQLQRQAEAPASRTVPSEKPTLQSMLEGIYLCTYVLCSRLCEPIGEGIDGVVCKILEKL
jgi:hypothetical protein